MAVDWENKSLKPIEFTVEGNPESKLRARTYSNYRIINGKIKHWVSTMTPDKTRKNENKIRFYALKARLELYREPLECDVIVNIKAFMQIPSWSNIKKKRAMLGIIKPNTKPDCDNVMKSVLDAMNTKKRKEIIINSGVYYDDTQVVKATIQQLYSDKPRLEVKVIPIEQKNIDIAYRKGKWWYIDKATKKVIADVESEKGEAITNEFRLGAKNEDK